MSFIAFPAVSSLLSCFKLTEMCHVLALKSLHLLTQTANTSSVPYVHSDTLFCPRSTHPCNCMFTSLFINPGDGMEEKECQAGRIGPVKHSDLISSYQLKSSLPLDTVFLLLLTFYWLRSFYKTLNCLTWRQEWKTVGRRACYCNPCCVKFYFVMVAFFLIKKILS